MPLKIYNYNVGIKGLRFLNNPEKIKKFDKKEMKILLNFKFLQEGNEMKFNFILNLFKPNNKNITPLNLSFYITISYEATISNKSIFQLGKNTLLGKK